ncbi:MAG: winged helix-turn-helix domain-containing protein [Halobacteriaceae archaeon]
MSKTDSTAAPGEAGDYPTGWGLIARNRSVVNIVDTLLDLPPHREFNKSELAELADVSRKSVHTHLDLLLELGIVEEVPETSPQRYRFDPESEISTLIIKLDGAINNAGPEAAD